MKEKIFCEECRDYVDVNVFQKELEGKIKGVVYKYKGETAYCCKCGDEVYVAEINDKNLTSLYDVYSKSTKIC